MKIDMFTHILPDKYFRKLLEKAPSGFPLEKRVKGVPALTNLEERFKVMDRFDDYAQVVTLVAPPLEVVAGPRDTPELAKIANDEMAELAIKYPNRFVGAVGCLPMNNRDAAIKELDRAISELKLDGILVYTDVDGKPLDDPEFSFLFEKMAEYDRPIWLHPNRGVSTADYRTEKKSRYDVWVILGWPYETSVAMTRIVFSGVFDKFPNLKIITHHLGGMIPYFAERIRGGYENFGTRTDEDARAILAGMKKPVHEYFKMFYADTVVFGSVLALECAFKFFGPERIVFASDMPFDPDQGYRKIHRTITGIEGMNAAVEEKSKIFELNARRLLRQKD